MQQSPRYALIEDSLQGVLRTPICGQHVHVGMPDEETAVRAYNGIRTHVPLINALAANSPFWFGEDSGLASSRTVIFRSYPRAAMAPEFDDFDHFCRVTRQVCRPAGSTTTPTSGGTPASTPASGRSRSAPPTPNSTCAGSAALAALVHCLARIEAERDQAGHPAREALAESSFQATRHGLDAKLLDRDAASGAGARARRAHASSRGRRSPAELGCESELAHVEMMLEEGSGADLQLRVHAEAGWTGCSPTWSRRPPALRASEILLRTWGPLKSSSSGKLSRRSTAGTRAPSPRLLDPGFELVERFDVSTSPGAHRGVEGALSWYRERRAAMVLL